MPSAIQLESVRIRTDLLPTDEDVRFYQEHGYWIGPVVFNAEETAALAEHQDLVYKGIHETGREPWRGGWKFKENRPNEIRKTDNAHWSDLTIRKAVLDATIGAMAAKLHGVNVVRLWHDQLLYKPPGGGQTGNVGWHQDYGYWRACKEPNLTTVTLAVNENTPENGVIESMPGSHKRGLLHASDFFNQDLDGMRKAIETESGAALQTIPMTLKAGQVSFHHCLTIHGSRANQTQTPRRSIAIHLMCGEIHRNINGKHMNTEIAELKDGDPFIGEPFPVLYEA